VKKLTYLCVAFALAAMLGLPAAAQKSHRNSGANKQTGLARAEEVQNPNGDKDRKGGRKTRKNKKGDQDPAASMNKTEGNHKALGHLKH
jgi:hypothetical protein